MKRVLAIEDLSCVGRCALTVALPVLSAMGHECSVLPTAVLSTHTGFPQPHRHMLTQELVPIADHWKSQDISFDGILVGYLADEDQAAEVDSLLGRFAGMKVLDPAMGDGGKLYGGLDADMVDAMKCLCRRADVVLPNVTEAALLTGLPYQPVGDGSYYRELMLGLSKLGPKTVVITGVRNPDGRTGFVGMCQEGMFSYLTPRLPLELHGTGDLFSSVYTGALLLDKDPMEAGELAAKFVEQAILATPEKTPYGPHFEKALPWLWESLEEKQIEI